MKLLKALFATIILLIACTVSYSIGITTECNRHTKDYEAACLQADFIRYIIDEFDGETSMANIGMEIQDSYEEYFQDLDNHNIWNTDHIKSIKDLDNYYWAY